MKQTIKTRVNIGAASILFILILLCLSVFVLLSLNSAQNAYETAQRRAASVTAYYQADDAAQRWIHQLRQEGTPGEYHASFPLSDEQSLEVSVEGTDFSIRSYQVVNTHEYAIDDRLPVWQENP